MHPTLEQLLAFRDGERPEGVGEHLAACAECTAELARLRGVAEGLRRLPVQEPPKDLWPALRVRVQAERRRRWISAVAVAASLVLAASLVAAILLHRAPAGGPETAAVVQKPPSQPSDIQPLITESQKLESVLRRASSGTPVLSGKAAGTIANLEDGIAILDFKISLVKDTADQHDQLKRLWQQRVKMLQALVQVHTSRGDYAQL